MHLKYVYKVCTWQCPSLHGVQGCNSVQYLPLLLSQSIDELASLPPLLLAMQSNLLYVLNYIDIHICIFNKSLLCVSSTYKYDLDP